MNARSTRLIGFEGRDLFTVDTPAVAAAKAGRRSAGQREQTPATATEVAEQVEGVVQAPRVKPPGTKKK